MNIKIFNINMWLLPFRLSKNNSQRVKLLSEFINKKQPDIIALQEVWEIKHIDFLKEHLKKYIFYFEGRKKLNVSGLVTLSKHVPVKKEFLPFKKNGEMIFLEKRIEKGVLITEYLVNGEHFAFYNTHLYTPTKDIQKKITMNQLEFIKKNINQNTRSFLCGDLNLDKPEFETANKRFFRYAENVNNTFSSESKYIKKWWDPKVKPNKKIDYVLIKTNKRFSFRSEVVNEDLSDHFGIYTEVEF